MTFSSFFEYIPTSFFVKSYDRYYFVVPVAILSASNWIFFDFIFFVLSTIVSNYISIFDYRSDERCINDLK